MEGINKSAISAIFSALLTACLLLFSGSVYAVGYTITTGTNGSGTVTRSPNNSLYPASSTVVVTATPATGWYFAGWSGSIGDAINLAWKLAAVLRGRHVAGHVTAICVPGSAAVKREAEAEGLDAVFKAAGFEWHEPGCGHCGSGKGRLEDLRIISTSNRNFENRQGKRVRTHLASPVTVAASAVAGHIADVRQLHR